MPLATGEDSHRVLGRELSGADPKSRLYDGTGHVEVGRHRVGLRATHSGSCTGEKEEQQSTPALTHSVAIHCSDDRVPRAQAGLPVTAKVVREYPRGHIHV